MITGNSENSLSCWPHLCICFVLSGDQTYDIRVYISSVLEPTQTGDFSILMPISPQKVSDGHSDPFGSSQMNNGGDVVLSEGAGVLIEQGQN